MTQFGHHDNHESIVATTKINGQPLSLVAIHPVSPKGSQMFSARNTLFSDVASYVKAQTNPVVMIGDFNTTMWSPYYQQIIRQTNLKNVRKGFGIEPTWPKNRPSLSKWRQLSLGLFQIPIDHCLVSPDIQVADMRAGANTESDHAPIVVDLAL